MAESKKTLYDILGVERDANPLDIGLAYKKYRDELARAAPQDPSALSLVHEAHEVLANPARRAAYDASLVTQAEKAAAREQEPDLILEPEPESDRKPLFVGIGAGLVVIVAALYFTMRAPTAPKDAVAVEAPKSVVPAPPPPPQVLTPAVILQGAVSSIGHVLSYDPTGKTRLHGLAVAVDRSALVTTCHGIPAGSQLVVRVGAESHPATLAVTDEEFDLCKLAVPDLGGRGVPLNADELRAGEKVYAIGANAKGELALTEAEVKQLRPTPGGGKVIELSVPIAPNASGGALFDSYGRLAGITTTQHNFGAGLNIALPASWVARMQTRAK